ncbi:hypothetical protein EJD97_006833 [Solanum chilense]|uniref:Uncharacterized protein n=1 Tax=Solanum chilense TaxID=4083 RepID=A0A6N2AKY2_SOLCI|nr:hypothetical protein EJD97_006833 [Solanum chilense]
MGNCLVFLQNDNKKVIEYKAPLKVHEVSSPLLQEPKTKHVKKKVKFADEVMFMESSRENCSSSEVVRIKVVITKQELQSLLSSEGELKVLQDGNMVVQQSSISEINGCIIHELD